MPVREAGRVEASLDVGSAEPRVETIPRTVCGRDTAGNCED